MTPIVNQSIPLAPIYPQNTTPAPPSPKQRSMGSLSVITGTNGNDNLTGTELADTIYGLEGDDTIDGRGGVDWIDGGEGSDIASYIPRPLMLLSKISHSASSPYI